MKVWKLIGHIEDDNWELVDVDFGIPWEKSDDDYKYWIVDDDAYVPSEFHKNNKLNGRFEDRDDRYWSCDYEGISVYKQYTEESPKKSFIIQSQQTKLLQCQLDMLISFEKAIKDCGGSVETLVNPEMTLQDMLDRLAQNGIRFTYDPEGVLK